MPDILMSLLSVVLLISTQQRLQALNPATNDSSVQRNYNEHKHARSKGGTDEAQQQ
jgi:hypothetical protein